VRDLPAFYRRARVALSYQWPKLRVIGPWLMRSREDTNFTYEISPRNLLHLAHMLSVVLARPAAPMRAYLDEALNDRELADHVIESVRTSPASNRSDETCHFGRRLGWYATVRSVKPKVVVETGVDKGLGAVLLCAALRRNASEGEPGRYYGTDINPQAGYLLGGAYAAFGTILYGDSVVSLRGGREAIDVFISDSDHASDYEYQEYLAVRDRLSERAVVLADGAHSSDALMRFADETGRDFLFFREEPVGHWYPGAGIGFAYRR
jgi:predicted O-methyltransferase YrrM